MRKGTGENNMLVGEQAQVRGKCNTGEREFQIQYSQEKDKPGKVVCDYCP